jgi:6-pyruvoyltetrahydropterin/6-carboxytetrahydropterin synthase
MAHIHFTRRYRFSASHRLHSAELSAEQNRETYGKCNNPCGHGHDYVLEVTVAGELDSLRGRLIPVDSLDRFVGRLIIENFDRRNLNLEITEFASLVPTTENLARVVAARLASAWPAVFPAAKVRLEKVKIWETRRNIFEVLVSAERPDGEVHDEILESSRQRN